MIICPKYVVYESDKDVVHDWLPVLVMDTEDTPPCFTQLELYTNVNNLPNFFKQQLQQHRGKHLLSSELFKSQVLEQIQPFCPGLKLNMHGPCLSDINDMMDFAFCLKCDKRFQCETTRSVCEKTLYTVIESMTDYLYTSLNLNSVVLLSTLLNHCKSELSRCIFKRKFASLYQQLPCALPHVNNPNNKQQYKFYKHDLSQLLVGVRSDAVSGWLKLASFFYGHTNYLTSIDLINYTLSNVQMNHLCR
ncbi:unnamed protein product [Mytilus edulis]|uniref:Uncharacterized protein n=1 Tax=Mytilus edulis TaxID=6550 RepID=A0A8S3RZ47_MYTED|nr:unnamed protein product [Mytilus edulis]